MQLSKNLLFFRSAQGAPLRHDLLRVLWPARRSKGWRAYTGGCMREQPDGPSWEGSEAAENEWIMEIRDDHAL